MRRIRSAMIFYLEPKRVADWCELQWEVMRESQQPFSGRFFSIKLLYSIKKSPRPLSDICVKIVKETIRDYPELAEEAKQLFPEII